ncbi:MAG: TadE/TadG family type IV pilus assembly protein [Sphingomonadales bacterium]
MENGVVVMSSAFAFLRDETGAVTIEFVLWVPVFVSMLVFVTDASIIYLTHSEMWNVARDTTRRMTTGEITSQAEARDYAAAHLFLGQRTYVIDPSDPKFAEMNVTIAIGLGDATIFGFFFESILGRELVASVTMRREPLS